MVVNSINVCADREGADNSTTSRAEDGDHDVSRDERGRKLKMVILNLSDDVEVALP